ncbi:hypothetical protein LOK49_LG08G02144 [Camellia lanceoleosa]|uniref:Uncharacterized protein n=1 Tax=Camellia lanceoleosa TaxID=1840588 RepID=A0ACC0GUA3_9ERIC|nr:hypothetical protein LOK49_LG08G02144 [Camellia lanceoleosa]
MKTEKHGKGWALTRKHENGLQWRLLRWTGFTCMAWVGKSGVGSAITGLFLPHRCVCCVFFAGATWTGLVSGNGDLYAQELSVEMEIEEVMIQDGVDFVADGTALAMVVHGFQIFNAPAMAASSPTMVLVMELCVTLRDLNGGATTKLFLPMVLQLYVYKYVDWCVQMKSCSGNSNRCQLLIVKYR